MGKIARMIGVMRRMMATGPDSATTIRRKARKTMVEKMLRPRTLVTELGTVKCGTDAEAKCRYGTTGGTELQALCAKLMPHFDHAVAAIRSRTQPDTHFRRRAVAEPLNRGGTTLDTLHRRAARATRSSRAPERPATPCRMSQAPQALACRT